jgi:hypothetical protein
MPNFCSSPWIPVPLHPHWNLCQDSFCSFETVCFVRTPPFHSVISFCEQWGQRYEYFYCFRRCRSSFQFNLLRRIFSLTSFCTSYFYCLSCMYRCYYILSYNGSLSTSEAIWRSVRSSRIIIWGEREVWKKLLAFCNTVRLERRRKHLIPDPWLRFLHQC